MLVLLSVDENSLGVMHTLACGLHFYIVDASSSIGNSVRTASQLQHCERGIEGNGIRNVRGMDCVISHPFGKRDQQEHPGVTVFWWKGSGGRDQWTIHNSIDK